MSQFKSYNSGFEMQILKHTFELKEQFLSLFKFVGSNRIIFSIHFVNFFCRNIYNQQRQGDIKSIQQKVKFHIQENSIQNSLQVMNHFFGIEQFIVIISISVCSCLFEMCVFLYSKPNKTVTLQVQDKFRLDLSDEEAVHYMQSLIDESVHALFAAVVEQIHKFAQVSSLRAVCSSQLLCVLPQNPHRTIPFPANDIFSVFFVKPS